jgi:hypothetical protein
VGECRGREVGVEGFRPAVRGGVVTVIQVAAPTLTCRAALWEMSVT